MKASFITLLIFLAFTPVLAQKGLYNIGYGDKAVNISRDVFLHTYKIEDKDLEEIIPVLHPEEDILAGWYLVYKKANIDNVSNRIIANLAKIHGKNNKVGENGRITRWELGGEKYVEAGFDIWHDRFWVIYNNDEFPELFTLTRLTDELGTDDSLNRYMKQRLLDPDKLHYLGWFIDYLEYLELADRFNQPRIKETIKQGLYSRIEVLSDDEHFDDNALEAIQNIAEYLGDKNLVPTFMNKRATVAARREAEEKKQKQEEEKRKKEEQQRRKDPAYVRQLISGTYEGLGYFYSDERITIKKDGTYEIVSPNLIPTWTKGNYQIEKVHDNYIEIYISSTPRHSIDNSYMSSYMKIQNNYLQWGHFQYSK